MTNIRKNYLALPGINLREDYVKSTGSISKYNMPTVYLNVFS